MTKKIINAKIYERKDGVHIGPILDKIKDSFVFPESKPFLHILPATIDDYHRGWEKFFDDFNVSDIKPKDHLLIILPYEGGIVYGPSLKQVVLQKFYFLPKENFHFSHEMLNFNDWTAERKEAFGINQIPFISQHSFVPSNVKLNHSFDFKDKIFLCYNRLVKSHRCQIVANMKKYNLMENSLVGFLHTFQNRSATEVLLNDTHLSDSEKMELIPFVEETLTIDKYDTNTNGDLGISQKTNRIHYMRSLMSIITETHWYEDCITFTEKTYKALAHSHPFISVSPPHQLKKLRELGFKTYDLFVDEHYDTIEDPLKRMKAIVDEMRRIYNLSEQEQYDFFLKCQPIADFNYALYHSNEFVKNAEIRKFLNNFEILP